MKLLTIYFTTHSKLAPHSNQHKQQENPKID